VDHVAARLQPVDRSRGGIYRARWRGCRNRRRDAHLPRSRLAECSEGPTATDARRARGGDRARGREPGTAEAHDRARDHARARAGAVESRRGGKRHETDRRADGRWDGDIDRVDPCSDPRAVLPVAPPRIERLMNRVALLRRGVALGE